MNKPSRVAAREWARKKLESIDVKKRPDWMGKIHLSLSYDEMRALEAICRRSLGSRRRIATEALLAGIPIVAKRFGVTVRFK